MNVLLLNNETWLICGGRNFSDQTMFDDVMDGCTRAWGCPEKIVHGAAAGADAMADAWGKRMNIQIAACPADWAGLGLAAGPVRNEDMLMEHKPQRVIAFPGGKGTADMVRRAKKRGADKITVIEIQSP